MALFVLSNIYLSDHSVEGKRKRHNLIANLRDHAELHAKIRSCFGRTVTMRTVISGLQLDVKRRYPSKPEHPENAPLAPPYRATSLRVSRISTPPLSSIFPHQHTFGQRQHIQNRKVAILSSRCKVIKLKPHNVYVGCPNVSSWEAEPKARIVRNGEALGCADDDIL